MLTGSISNALKKKTKHTKKKKTPKKWPFRKMSKVTSCQVLVIGWAFQHCMTKRRLQNSFTNTILLKLGAYINFLSLQDFKKHQFWDR